MKKIKFLVLAVSALAIVWAFRPKKPAGIDTWYKYNLTTNAGFENPANYSFYSSTEPTGLCGGGTDQIVCAIKVDNDTEVYPANYSVVSFRGRPKVDITGIGTIHDIIADAIDTQTESPGRVLLK